MADHQFLPWVLDCPKGWLKISTFEMHTGGEPLRVIAGLPPIDGDTVLEKRRYFRVSNDIRN